MKGEKGQVSHFKPMQIDTHLGYDVYKIFINVISLNEIKAQDKIDFFSYWIDKGMFNKKRWQGHLLNWWYIVERKYYKISKATVYKNIAEHDIKFLHDFP